MGCGVLGGGVSGHRMITIVSDAEVPIRPAFWGWGDWGCRVGIGRLRRGVEGEGRGPLVDAAR